MMPAITTLDELREAILLLEKEQLNTGGLLKKQAEEVYESIKPINLIKSTLKQVTESPEIKTGLLNAALGMGAGYLAKFIFQSVVKGPFAKIAGTVLQFGVSNAAINYSGLLNAEGKQIVNTVITQHNNETNEQRTS